MRMKIFPTNLLVLMAMGIIVVELSALTTAFHLGLIGENENVTKEAALNSLLESKKIIEKMNENDLPILFIEDTLLTAERMFDQALYASILREEISASGAEIKEAQDKLELIDWERITYGDVVFYTNQIKEREDRTFNFYDSIITAKVNLLQEINPKLLISGKVTLSKNINETTFKSTFLGELEGDIDEETEKLFNELSIAFYEDRDDVEELLEEFNAHVELKRLESTRLSLLRANTTNFVQRNWEFILLFLIILGAVGYVFQKRISKRNLEKKIEKMKLGKGFILGLIKKIQIERFKQNKLSKVVYDLRIKKYNKKLNEIKEELPLLEAKLKDLKGEIKE